MFSKINHVVIVSYDYAQFAQFYEAVFDMRTSAKTRVGSAVTVGDGYVGLNINPRRAGRAAGLDHFGIEVEDVETVFDRMRTSYPSVKWLQRPSNRPFAGITTHDPDGNVFDISQKDMKNRTSVYVEDDGNHYLTDGHVTLVIMPWDITDYEGTGIITPGMDHIGFKVENIDAFKQDVERIAADNPRLAPAPMTGAEGKALERLFRRSCPLGQHQMADCDGILIDVAAD